MILVNLLKTGRTTFESVGSDSPSSTYEGQSVGYFVVVMKMDLFEMILPNNCLFVSRRFVGSTAKLPQQLSLAGNTLANTGTTFGESANLNGKVGKIESRDTDRGNGRGESPLATPPEGDDSRSSPDSSDEADALSPSLWKLVERGDICPFEDCAFTVSAAEGREKFKSNRDSKGLFGEGKGMSIGGEKNRSRCRHFHTLCGCRHTRGAFKGLLFQVGYRGDVVSSGFSRVPWGD